MKDLRELVGKDYIVCSDNYFNSVHLMIDLQQDKILSCGTIQWNRKIFPAENFPDGKKMAHGESSFR